MKKVLSFFVAGMLVLAMGLTAMAAKPIPFDGRAVFGSTSDEDILTRGQFAVYMAQTLVDKGYNLSFRAEPKAPFADVPLDSEYYEAVDFLKNLGIVQGGGNGLFLPDDNIRYEDAVVMAVRSVTSEEIGEADVKARGGYPIGYLAYASEHKLTNGAGGIVGEPVTVAAAKKLMENIWDRFPTYDLMRPLGADYYNGELYVIIEPATWQGCDIYSAKHPEGYYENLVPGRMLISRDGENWETAYEDIDGERVYYMLPEGNSEVTKYKYKVSGYFESDLDKFKSWYSRDLISWTRGKTPYTYVDYGDSIWGPPMAPASFGVTKNDLNGLYITHRNIGTEVYSYRGEDMYLFRSDVIWFSKDGRDWINMVAPEELEFVSSVDITPGTDLIFITGYMKFSDEENAFLDQEAAKAETLGLLYDRPLYKEVKYYISVAELEELLG